VFSFCVVTAATQSSGTPATLVSSLPQAAVTCYAERRIKVLCFNCVCFKAELNCEHWNKGTHESAAGPTTIGAKFICRSLFARSIYFSSMLTLSLRHFLHTLYHEYKSNEARLNNI
jgi:hypothetical protein